MANLSGRFEMEGAIVAERSVADILIVRFVGRGTFDHDSRLAYECEHRWVKPGESNDASPMGATFCACKKPNLKKSLFDQFNLWY